MNPAGWLRRPSTWGVVLLLVAGLLLAFLRFAPFFRVQHVDVQGNSQVTADEVVAAADVSEDGALMTVPLEEIASRVETLDAVAGADVTRDWPNRVQIVVRERRSVGYTSRAAGMALIGSDGLLYREQEIPPKNVPQLPDATAAVGDSYPDSVDDSARAAYDVAVALPAALRRSVASIEAPTASAIRLVFPEGVVVEWGTPGAADQKATVVIGLRDRKGWGTVFTSVDVSAPEAPALS
ncbi:MAG: FtsQ-type POTRA domain-containing protein [Actinomycetes bacterium]